MTPPPRRTSAWLATLLLTAWPPARVDAQTRVANAVRDSPATRVLRVPVEPLLTHLRSHASACVIGSIDRTDVPLDPAVVQAVSRRAADVAFFPACDAGTPGRLWVQGGEHVVHVSDGVCECSYTRRWRWRRLWFSWTGLCLCE